LRSVDSKTALRGGSEIITGVNTPDGNGEERKSKDDKGKRLKIVREIVE
jgi:hypothetical protein